MSEDNINPYQILRRFSDWGDRLSVMYSMQIRDMIKDTIIRANQVLEPGQDLAERLDQLIEKEVTPYALELYKNFMENQRKKLDLNTFIIDKEKPFSKEGNGFFSIVVKQYAEEFPFSTASNLIYYPDFDLREHKIISLDSVAEDTGGWTY